MPPFYTYISAGSEPFSFGNALQFDGVNDYIAPQASDLITLPSTFSINFWVKGFSASGTANGNIFGLQNEGGIGAGILIGQASNLGRLFWVSTNTYVQFTTNNINPANWTMVSLVSNGTSMDVYFNGAFEQTFTNQNRTYTMLLSPPIFLRYYNGILDELLITNNLLTSSEISQLYNSGNGAKATSIISPSNALFYLQFNQVAGDNVALGTDGAREMVLNNFDTSTCWVAH